MIGRNHFYHSIDIAKAAMQLPAKASSKVDFPDPLGPIIAIIDPGSAYPAVNTNH